MKFTLEFLLALIFMALIVWCILTDKILNCYRRFVDRCLSFFSFRDLSCCFLLLLWPILYVMMSLALIGAIICILISVAALPIFIIPAYIYNIYDFYRILKMQPRLRELATVESPAEFLEITTQEAQERER